jgi:hypothetical protein
MTTEVISSNTYRPVSKVVRTSSVKTFTNALKVFSNFVSFLKALQYLNIKVVGSTVTIQHETGTLVTFREDGNVDVISERNFVQKTKGLLHLNPASLEDDKYTDFEDFVNAQPERFKNCN